MTRDVGTVALALVLTVAAVATIGALQTKWPGQMTEARVFVQNQGRTEAVPVDLLDVSLDKPLRVHVANGEPGGGDALPTRAARQLWDYETIVVLSGRDVAAALNARGAAGWEAVGTTSVTSESLTILLKRPR